MKRRLCSLLFLPATLFLFALACGAEIPVEPYSSHPTAGEMAFVAQWKHFLLRQGDANAGRYVADLPFSFKSGERSSREWVKIETAKIESGDWQDDKTRTHVLRWKDVQTSLSCEMKLTEFRDFPALQWVVYVRNDGQTDSAKVHDFWGIDTYWNAADGSMPILHRSVGSPGHEDDFHFMSEIMHNSMWDKRRRIAMDTPTNARWGQTHAYHIPTDKRSSAIWLPFFNYQTGGDGLITGLGWSGAWRAYFDHQGGGNSTILAGVENFDSILHPGETVRSTLNLALYWQGEMMHGQNMFRRLVLDHYSPHIDGKLVEPPISGVVWGGIPSKEHLDIIEKIKEYEIPLDVYWFDAGWYGTGVVPSYTVFEGDWGIMAGDWRPNPNWHHGTLKPVSDAAHAAGMKFLVWVEPCRAHSRPTDHARTSRILPDRKRRRQNPRRADASPGSRQTGIVQMGGRCRRRSDQGLRCRLVRGGFQYRTESLSGNRRRTGPLGNERDAVHRRSFCILGRTSQPIPASGDSQLRQRRTTNRPRNRFRAVNLSGGAITTAGPKRLLNRRRIKVTEFFIGSRFKGA